MLQFQYGVNKVVGNRAQQYAAEDPYYHVNEETGKRGKRPLPNGLTMDEEKVWLLWTMSCL